MANISYTVVDAPSTGAGRPEAPNPYKDAADAILKLERGKAIQFQPLNDEAGTAHTYAAVKRFLGKAAGERATIRTKHDEKTNTITAWAIDKIKRGKGTSPEELAAIVAKRAEAAATAPAAKPENATPAKSENVPAAKPELPKRVPASNKK